MWKNPGLNGLVCSAYDQAWRTIELSERQDAPKLFAHVEHLVDSGHTDTGMIASSAIRMLRGQSRPPEPQAQHDGRFAWFKRTGMPFAFAIRSTGRLLGAAAD